jgi:hypothetical protein
MASPMIAPATAAAITIGTSRVPCPASAPAVMITASPGTRRPRKALVSAAAMAKTKT